MKHPIQYVVKDEQGVDRFTENKIIRFLVDEYTDLNRLCIKYQEEGWDKADYDQLMQLIGYSHSAAPIHRDILNVSDIMVEDQLDERDAKIKYYEGLIKLVKWSLRDPIVKLNSVLEDELGEEL